MSMSPKLMRPRASGFDPRSISGLALWLDASASGDLYTTDAGPVTAVSAPTEISGCQLWLDASDAASITSSGGVVSQWADKSATGSLWTVTSGDGGPATGTATMGGRNVLLFDGSNDSLSASAPLNTSMPLTFFVVQRVVSATFIGMTYCVGDADAFAWRQSNASNGNLQITAGNGTVIGDGGPQVGLNLVYSYTVPASGSSVLQANGSGLAVTSTSLKPALTGTHYLGRRGGATGYYANIQIAEIIAFSTQLSTTDRARVEAYLAAKWGIAGVHAPATTASDPVGYWRDRSGNGRHVVQALSANRPVVGSQNSRKAMTFDGANDNLNSTPSSTVGADGITFIAAVKHNLTSQPTYLSMPGDMSSGNSGRPITRWQQTDATNRMFVGVTLGAVTSAYRSQPDRFIHCIDGRKDNAGSGNHTLREFFNGSQVASVDISAAWTTTGQKFNIGSRGDNVTQYKGDICELLCYGRALTISERQRLERYLAAKWGITLAPQVSNADAQDWVNRVYANGGSVSASTASAVNTFCDAIDAASLRDRFYRLNLFCGTGINAALVPLYRGASLGGTQYGNTTDTNVGPFVSGDYNETGTSGGLTGNGSSKYLNTGLNASIIGAAGHAAMYHRASIENAGAAMLRVSDGVSNIFGLDYSTGVTNMRGFWGSTGTAAFGSTGGGLHTVTRSSATDLEYYRNGGSVGTQTTSVTPSAPAQPFYVFASNQNGTPGIYSAANLQAYSLGLSMTGSQAAAYYTAMQAFQTALERNV